MSKIETSEWVSQAKAARLRGVSRQAIWKLVVRGRIRSVEIAGHKLVSLADVKSFKRGRAGRSSAGEKREQRQRD